MLVLLGFVVTVVLGATSGCSSSACPGSGASGGAGRAGGGGSATGGNVGGVAGSTPGGRGDAGRGGDGSTGGAEGGAAAGGGGAPVEGSGGGGAAPAPSSGGAGGGTAGGQGNPCGDTVVCTYGAIRCANGRVQTCLLDENRCEQWGPLSGPLMTLPNCPVDHVVCDATAEPTCDCSPCKVTLLRQLLGEVVRRPEFAGSGS
ncbi:MAG TPA: hypothetical protein VIU64_22845, partial [Polyangia bacterium]